MKSFITALIIGFILFSGSIFYMSHLKDRADSLIEINEKISVSVKNEDFSQSSQYIAELKSQLDKFEDFFLATGNHTEIDNIKSNLAELEAFSEGKMKTDALSKVYTLDFLLSHLPESVSFRMGNIL